MARAQDPMREAAALALNATGYEGDRLKAVLRYCWEQLLWRQTDAELTALLDGLRAELDEAV